MAKAPQKRLLEEHESSVRMNAAAANRCREDTTTWRDWGDIGDPVLHPQPRRKRRRKPQKRTDARFSNEPIQRVRARDGSIRAFTRFASCTITLNPDA